MLSHLKNSLRAAFLHREARSYIKNEQYEKAEPVLQLAIKLRPDIGKYKSSLGYCYWQTGQEDKAEPLLFEGAHQSPWWYEANEYLADFLLERRRYAEAISPLKQLMFFDTNQAIDKEEQVANKYRQARRGANMPPSSNYFPKAA
jgi:tetratricopeptide (TPR) repeat protein